MLGGTTVSAGKYPKSMNFFDICVRRESDGTMSKIRSHRWYIMVASIVSVFPVPVGSTTVAGSTCKSVAK